MTTAITVATVKDFGLAALSRRMAALAGAEMLNRGTRILTAIALGRMLGPYEFGIAALAITTSELLRVLTQTGLGARVIQCTEEEIDGVSAAVHRINWWTCGMVFAGHAIAAAVLGATAEDWRLPALVMLLAIPVLIYPMATVPVFMVQRANDMGFAARMLAVQTVLDNLLTAVLALAGFGLWAVALPKLAVALVWVTCYRRKRPWSPKPATGPLPYRSTLRFGLVVLASEMTAALRSHADKFIVGATAGINLLGTWFFAFNAGIGLTASIVMALSAAVLPHAASLPKDHRYLREMMKALALGLAITTPVIVAQALLAPVYVPLLFGRNWAHAAPLVSILCTSAIALPALRFASLMLRAANRPGLELLLSALHGTACIVAVTVWSKQSLEAAAWALVAVNMAAAPVFIAAAARANRPQTGSKS